MTQLKPRNFFYACLPLILFTQVFISSTAKAEELVVVVNQNNQIRNITIEKIKKIFSGQVRFWKNGNKISPFHLGKNSKQKESFIDAVFNQSPRAHGRFWLSQKQKSGETEPTGLGEEASLAWIVSRDPYAIGYLSRTGYEGLKESLRGKLRPILRIQN